jgi:hypothetical protein
VGKELARVGRIFATWQFFCQQRRGGGEKDIEGHGFSAGGKHFFSRFFTVLKC